MDMKTIANEASKQKYLIFSGEGEYGKWELTSNITKVGLKRRLTVGRCGGDRWARAYEPDAIMFNGDTVADDIIRLVCYDIGDYRSKSREELVELGYNMKDLPR